MSASSFFYAKIASDIFLGTRPLDGLLLVTLFETTVRLALDPEATTTRSSMEVSLYALISNSAMEDVEIVCPPYS